MITAWRFPLPEGKGPRRCSIGSVTIRKTFGNDESVAVAFAEARGTEAAAELVHTSIVKVDDAVVEQPFLGFNDWNVRTRDLVAFAFNTINGMVRGELAPFFDSAEQVGDAWRYTIPVIDDEHKDKRECEIRVIVAKEVLGTDETASIKLGGDPAFVRLRPGIVSVDGTPLDEERFAGLSSRARRFILQAFENINGSDGAADFLRGASEDAVADPEPGASEEEAFSEAG